MAEYLSFCIHPNLKVYCENSEKVIKETKLSKHSHSDHSVNQLVIVHSGSCITLTIHIYYFKKKTFQVEPCRTSLFHAVGSVQLHS
jgi:hypothetical protein